MLTDVHQGQQEKAHSAPVELYQLPLVAAAQDLTSLGITDPRAEASPDPESGERGWLDTVPGWLASVGILAGGSGPRLSSASILCPVLPAGESVWLRIPASVQK